MEDSSIDENLNLFVAHPQLNMIEGTSTFNTRNTKAISNEK